MRQSPLRARRTSKLNHMTVSSLDGLERAQHVEHAISLEAALAAEIGRALTEDAFDPPGLPDQLGVAREEHRRTPPPGRARHARSRLRTPLVARDGRLDALARRYEVRLEPAV